MGEPQNFQNLFLIGQSKMMFAKANSKLGSHPQLFKPIVIHID
jgi:hypothetical protein